MAPLDFSTITWPY